VATAITQHTLSNRAGNAPALSYLTADPTGRALGVVGIIHGYADHAERYSHVIDALTTEGYACIALDLRGHGRSEGERGYCSDFREFLEDASELRRMVTEKQRALAKDGTRAPTAFLFGHSFGGLVATYSVLEEQGPWDGLMLSGPFFGLAFEAPAVKKIAAKILGHLVPKLSLASGLGGKDVTHDPVKAEGYDRDPLVFKKANARWFIEISAAQARLETQIANLKLPLFVGFGGADHVAHLETARTRVSAAGSKPKTFRAYDGLFHEILNEPSWREVLEDYLGFMRSVRS
jgi:alpha-beta hydrolase superfamily lysophospholipase